MPIITLEGGKLTKEQKREFIHRFAEAVPEEQMFNFIDANNANQLSVYHIKLTGN